MPYHTVRIIPHSIETIPECGTIEVRVSYFFAWDDNKGRRDMSLSVDMTKEQALEAAKEFARKEREKLDGNA